MAYTTIDNPGLFFNTKLYAGNGGTQSITGVGFQPDFVWIKDRGQVNSHFLYDVIRTATKRLNTNNTNAESTISNSLTSFDSDGFSLGNYAGTNDNYNYASWNWLAGGTASSNTDGDINSTVSANTTAGFSIVKWVGTGSNATIGHGLGVKPAMIITKPTSAIGSWYTYHKSTDATDFIKLNSTDATADNATVWNDTEPTTSVFTTGTAFDSGRTFIAYCFAEKKGYSKFGKYTGNGSTDGTFVYTGFRPAFVITKRTDGAVDWYMFDNKRQNSFNVVNGMLRPSANSVELDDSSVYVDFLSNGFKWKGNNAGDNTSGGTYIFMAFAEAPFVTAGTKAPGTAR
jgi:hypothetical protein|tara:strand:- start:1554 stop:2582 length:1029 start_codon:yes stop_codon:yes gene_type:complete